MNIELPELLRRLQTEGVACELIDNWRSANVLALLINTEGGSQYIVEPAVDKPSLVSRITEAQPNYGEYTLSASTPIYRREGNPDHVLKVGKCMNILGLSRKGSEFDPDSLYTTMLVAEIKLLEQD